MYKSILVIGALTLSLNASMVEFKEYVDCMHKGNFEFMMKQAERAAIDRIANPKTSYFDRIVLIDKHYREVAENYFCDTEEVKYLGDNRAVNYLVAYETALFGKFVELELQIRAEDK